MYAKIFGYENSEPTITYKQVSNFGMHNEKLIMDGKVFDESDLVKVYVFSDSGAFIEGFNLGYDGETNEHNAL